jgi:hypothetical protein
MEVIPAISMALFAGHFVDQKKKVTFQMYFGFQSLVWACFIYMASFYKDFTTQTILFHLLFVFFGGLVHAFLGQQYFLFSVIVPKKYIKCCHLSSSVWQISRLGPAVAGFRSIGLVFMVRIHRFGMLLLR